VHHLTVSLDIFQTMLYTIHSCLLDFVNTLCPNKSDPSADFLITCTKVYRIKHNFVNTCPYVHCVSKKCTNFEMV